MTNALLYIATVLIWGSTWIAIKFQLGTISEEVSIAYRFGLASLILMVWCLIRAKPLRFSLQNHLWMAALGGCLFSGNYLFMYLATGHIPSGLVSVVFCTMVIMNIVLSRLFFNTKIQPRVLIGGALGMSGIALVFSPEVTTFDFSDQGAIGLVLVLCGTFVASLGNMISSRNQKSGIPVLQANAWGMGYGALFMMIAAIVQGKEFGFDASAGYIGSLLYLSFFGSVVAFGCYLTLLGRIGAEKAVYSIVLFPIIALSISTFYEGYNWPHEAVIGVALVLWGNLLVLTKSGSMNIFIRKIARA